MRVCLTSGYDSCECMLLNLEDNCIYIVHKFPEKVLCRVVFFFIWVKDQRLFAFFIHSINHTKWFWMKVAWYNATVEKPLNIVIRVHLQILKMSSGLFCHILWFCSPSRAHLHQPSSSWLLWYGKLGFEKSIWCFFVPFVKRSKAVCAQFVHFINHNIKNLSWDVWQESKVLLCCSDN